MLLRGKASEDQLQFNPEIEKSAKSNRKKAKAKKKQGVQLESQPSRYWIERDEKGKKSRTARISRPSERDQRPQALATGQFSLRREYLAPASSSRPSEVWGKLFAIYTETKACEERKRTKVNQKSRGNDSRL
ncbi:hypothetical protein Lal_00033946 [Lupinus albus]|nr:hypothetical protein Lal_00033946 [Lupinus albus]